MVTFGVLTLVSCNKGRPKNTDLVSRAYQMIDAQQPGQAILLLERGLQEDPENPEYKRVLSSAYAHRAGFKVQKLVPILKSAQEFQRLQGQTLENSPEKEKVKALALDASSLVSKAGGLSEVFASIPAVQGPQVSDMIHAIEILSELGPELQPADAIFKVILEVILFKHYLVENLLGESPASSNKELENCQIQADLFIETFQTLSQLLIDIYSDLRIAHPSQTPQFERLTKETKESVKTALKTAQGISSLDKNSLLFLKFTLIKTGFGKVILCR